MKRLLFLFILFPASSLFATTWYVRADGGTRYSANVTTGQCNGQYDASYASTGGTGVNQNCAFNDMRFLWADGSYTTGTSFPGWGWVIAGSDTVIVRNCIQYSAPKVPIPGSSGDCAIGYSGPNANDYYLAQAGNPGGSGMPSPPAGTSGAHTQILGQNYASCTSPSAKTRVYGAYGTGSVMQVRSTSYVDIACFDITDHSSCGRSGLTNQCQTSYPLDNYANVGLTSNNTATHINLTDISIHGIAANGMGGPTGDDFNVTRVSLAGDSSAGWNLDDGTTGSGHLNMSYFSSMWSGCNEQYPVVDALPYFSCSDDLSGGYGDGWGTTTLASPPPGWQVSCDHCTFAYNTQDGMDGLHVGGTGSTITVTNSLFYGNMGNQLKIGGSAPIMRNNLLYGNSHALAQAIPGTPAPTSTFTGTSGGYAAFTGTITSGSNSVTAVSSTAGLQVGYYIYGTSIPGGATITAIGSGTLTMSANASASATESMNAGDPVLTGVSVTSGTITVGQSVSGASIRVGAFVAAYDSTAHTVTLSQGVRSSTGTSFSQLYNSALSDFGRAGDDVIAVSLSDSWTSDLQFNTVVGANSGAWLMVCGSGTCTAPVVNFNNNVLLGFLNNAANGYPNGSGNYIERIYFDPSVTQGYGVFLNPGSSFSYNATWHEKDGCPNTNETNALCIDPQLATSTWSLYGYWPIGPATAGSPIVGSGIAIAGVTTDYNGNPRPYPPNPLPSRGALEFSDPVVAPTLFTGSVSIRGSVVTR